MTTSSPSHALPETQPLTTAPRVSRDLAHRLEEIEAAAWGDLYRDLPQPVARKCGIRTRSFGTAAAVAAAEVDVLAFNRVLGLGAQSRPLTPRAVDALLDWYRAAGVRRFFVQPGPYTPPETLARLEARGFRRYNRWLKLWRDLEPPPPSRTDLRIEAAGPERGEDIARIFAASFGWPERVVPWVAARVGRPPWRHYVALDGERVVAAAALFLAPSGASMGPAATLPEARCRGAQQAFLERRLRDAADQGRGCLSVETAEPLPDRPVASLRNLLRQGFQIAYARTNWILELTAPSDAGGDGGRPGP